MDLYSPQNVSPNATAWRYETNHYAPSRQIGVTHYHSNIWSSIDHGGNFMYPRSSSSNE